MSALRREDGVTISELLVGMMLMIIVMSASLMLLDQFTAMSKRTDRAVDLQDAARSASRQVARSLRNLSASPDAPGVVERAEPYDLVFRAVDKPRTGTAQNTRNLHRLRYCLDSSSPSAAKLYSQEQEWNGPTAPPIPATTDCPGRSSWRDTRLVAERITNRANALERPLWTYRQADGAISSVKLNLFMNAQPKFRAREVALQTGVFLRNQNRAPTATFTATVAGVRHVLLNGSGSIDPEGQPLDYHWYADGSEIGRGLVFDYHSPNPGTRVLRLEVFDPGGLSHVSPQQLVAVQ
jgi:hypothetical protein